MKHSNLRYKQALLEVLPRDGQAFHVVAQLPPGSSQSALEDALYHWVARVNRFFLGRYWYKSGMESSRMSGVLFHERSFNDLPHAHLIVRPPIGASCLRFELDGRFMFGPHPEPIFRKFYRPATVRGKMFVRRIGSDTDDFERAFNYAAKGLERRAYEDQEWKFIGDLNRTPVRTI